jgi:hypothetical protein
LKVAVLCVAVLGLGSVQNSFAASPFDSFVNSVIKAIPFNPFDTVGNDFNKLVDANEFAKADAFFQDRYSSYFDKRFNQDSTDVTPLGIPADRDQSFRFLVTSDSGRS